MSRPRPAAALIMQALAPVPERAADLEPSAAWRAAGMRLLEDAHVPDGLAALPHETLMRSIELLGTHVAPALQAQAAAAELV